MINKLSILLVNHVSAVLNLKTVFNIRAALQLQFTICWCKHVSTTPGFLDNLVNHCLGGLIRNGTLLGPHFARANPDTKEYLRIVRYNVIQRKFSRHKIARNLTWWQQDRALAQTSNGSIINLRG